MWVRISSTRGAIFGASARLIWNVADWDSSSMLLNLGQSADPRSPHYRDHLERWRTGATQPLPFTWERVEALGVRRLEIPLTIGTVETAS